MRIFTRLLSLIVMCSIVGISSAQTYDLAISEVGTAANSSNQIPPSMVAPIFFTIKNNGSNIIPTGSEIWIAVQVNANYFIAPDTLVFNGDFPAGGEITLYTTAGYSFEASTPSYEICAGAYFTNAALESNPANNLNCDDYTVSSAVHNDWAALSMAIANPSNLDGFDLDNLTNTVPDIDSVVLILQNNSSITFPAFYAVNYQLALNGDTQNVSGVLSGDLAPGGQTTRIVNNASIIPATPQDSGTYTFCVIANEVGDNVDSNDVTCESFTIIDSYDPFQPSNWPLGTEEFNGTTLKVVPMIDAIRVEGVENPTEVTVMDMQGRLVRSVNLTEDANIQLNDEKSGVYIIQAADETNGAVEVKKFSKQ
ncbi:MAG: T9SS type A sorting domain-containing protein [Flavobacteriales bacterium]|nr:T9SS type A sorting domain-containing protein [Flavobacteriales bacterium]